MRLRFKATHLIPERFGFATEWLANVGLRNSPQSPRSLYSALTLNSYHYRGFSLQRQLTDLSHIMLMGQNCPRGGYKEPCLLRSPRDQQMSLLQCLRPLVSQGQAGADRSQPERSFQNNVQGHIKRWVRWPVSWAADLRGLKHH